MTFFRHKRNVVAFGCGFAAFAAAFALCLSRKKSVPAAAEPRRPNLPSVKAPAFSEEDREKEVTRLREKLMAEKNLSPEEKLQIAAQLATFSDAEMAALLESLGEFGRPHQARTIPLLCWAYRSPFATLDWLRRRDEAGRWRPVPATDDIVAVCASVDPDGVRAWYLKHHQEDQGVRDALGYAIICSLSRTDSLIAARLCEEAGGFRLFDREMEFFMQGVDDPRPYLTAALEKLTPLSVPKIDGRRVLEQENQHFLGWEALWQTGLKRWQQHDPAALEAWLRTQSPEIRDDAAALMANLDQRDQQHFAGKVELEIPPAFARDDFTAVPPAEAVPAVRQDWAAWWKQDAAAAEAFLQQCAWPEELKFRARAQAYAAEP